MLFEQRCDASVSVGGGLPRTYNVGALMNAWQGVGYDAIFLAGGSLYGLDAATRVRQFVEEKLRPETTKRSAIR